MAKFSVKVLEEAAEGAQAHGGGGGRALTRVGESGIPFLWWLSNNVAWVAGWRVGVGEREEVFGALGTLG